jgi:hypothetical protein
MISPREANTNTREPAHASAQLARGAIMAGDGPDAMHRGEAEIKNQSIGLNRGEDSASG